MVFLLTSVFGSPVIGVRCMRSGDSSQCEILESRFLGLIGNSSFAIPESEIGGAKTLSPLPHPGRGSGQYSVRLILKTGAYPSYPVLYTQTLERADAAARKLNAYFADPEAKAIELQEDFSGITSILLAFGVLAIAVVGAILRRRSGW